MPLRLSQKISDPLQGVYLIGTTPPKAGTQHDKTERIAKKLLQRLNSVEFDGLVVYDIQDESVRVPQQRPFPFQQTLDPRDYGQVLQRLAQRDVITYKSVTQRDAADFQHWIDETTGHYQQTNLVFVGSPSSQGTIKLSLSAAYQQLASQANSVFLGGVAIAERHASKGNEHERLLEKQRQGCQFFISQAVYNAQATIDLLTSYARSCRQQGLTPQRIILTFTPCGGAQTLDFMRWLGISIPEASSYRILDSADPLKESIRICRDNLQQILLHCAHLGLPLGLNVESLTNRKEEIDASITLFRLLKATMELHLAEKQVA
jgi:hypothetical protein